MKDSRTVWISLILVGLLAVPAQPQVIPGRWEKVETIKLGPPITVDLKNGDRIEGQLEGLFPSELSLRTGSATAAIPRSEIQRITTPKPDRLMNGVLIGAGMGVLPMAIVVSVVDDLAGPAYVVLTGAGFGALIGLGVDAIRMGDDVLYQPP